MRRDFRAYRDTPTGAPDRNVATRPDASNKGVYRFTIEDISDYVWKPRVRTEREEMHRKKVWDKLVLAARAIVAPDEGGELQPIIIGVSNIQVPAAESKDVSLNRV